MIVTAGHRYTATLNTTQQATAFNQATATTTIATIYYYCYYQNYQNYCLQVSMNLSTTNLKTLPYYTSSQHQLANMVISVRQQRMKLNKCLSTSKDDFL
jgi:hypothetical protein